MTARQRWTRRLAAAGTGTAAIVMAAGLAYAVWSQTGAGTGTAAAGTTAPLSAVAAVSDTLYPGGSATLTVTVSNPNQRPVTVTSIDLAGSVAASAGCTTPGVTVTLPASVSVTVPAGGSAPVSFTDAIAMTASSSSDCQGATFTIPVSAKGKTA
ncbi:hypothetical protein SAMN04489867_2333 [Pedococcus dokdonensis]|uniref:Uncharacterized protein n=1 Tax=Pedococcus dokdonensis TaxID=443156 RepID=A0A1H0SF36_9MICO|nr:hypothetical protein [Pedococcus dokdonensis]SDP40295.1 hypothetical protein SAMN04489867_2333 [Pedococcus dokdonensis]